MATEREAGRLAAVPIRSSFRPSRGLAALLVIELALWAVLFLGAHLFHEGPNGKGMGADFAVFVAGAQVIRDGGNPYDPAPLYSAERRLLTRERLPVTSRRNLVRLGNPPILYWALQPLTTRRFVPTALIWIGATYLLSALALAIVIPLRAGRSAVLATITFLLLPQVVVGAAYGNVTAIVFAALALGALLVRRYPLFAGVALTLLWLKPQVGFPLVLLLWAFEAPSRPRMAAGFVAGTLLLFVLTLIAVGWDLIVDWWVGLFTFSKSVAQQPALVSLSGLYAPWSSRVLSALLTAATLAIALGLTWWAWHRAGRMGSTLPSPPWLWVVWLLATPYAHFPDEIVLAVPLATLLASHAPPSPRPLSTLLLYTLFCSVIFLPQIGGVSLLPLPLMALGVLLYRQWNRTELGDTAMIASAAG